MFEYRVVFEKAKFVLLGSIQGNVRFTVAESESGNFTVAEVRILWHISWFKNHQGVVPLLNKPGLFFISRFIYVVVIQKSTHALLHILCHFY